MEILGIGPLEFLLILIIALVVLGPNDMVKAGRMLGAGLRRIITSPVWRTIQQASQEIRTLPNTLMREAGVEEIQQEIKESLPTDEQILVDTGFNELRKDVNTIQKSLSGLPTPTDGIPASSAHQDAMPSAPRPAQKDASDWVTPVERAVQPTAPADEAMADAPATEQAAGQVAEQLSSQEQISSGVQVASVPPEQLSSPEEPLQI